MHHFIAIGGFRFELQSGNAQIGSNLMIFLPPVVEILQMILKNNRASVLCPFKLYASFCSHRWIAIWVTVQKWTNWVLTSVTLTFDLWPWPLAWTSLLSMVITWQGPSHSISSLQKQKPELWYCKIFLDWSTFHIHSRISRKQLLDIYKSSIRGITYCHMFVSEPTMTWCELSLFYCFEDRILPM